jgi:hypothetical protein
MKNIAIACAVVAALGACIALAIVFMPAKREWANDYRQYASTLDQDDPVHATLAPMLADDKLTIWEISRILCGDAFGCRLNNFADILLSPDAADMFAQTVLVSLKHRKASGGQNSNVAASPRKRLA